MFYSETLHRDISETEACLYLWGWINSEMEHPQMPFFCICMTISREAHLRWKQACKRTRQEKTKKQKTKWETEEKLMYNQEYHVVYLWKKGNRMQKNQCHCSWIHWHTSLSHSAPHLSAVDRYLTFKYKQSYQSNKKNKINKIKNCQSRGTSNPNYIGCKITLNYCPSMSKEEMN